MAKIDRYNGNVQAFASDAIGTERTVFGGTTQSDDLSDQLTADFLRGWGVVGASEFPTMQDFSAGMFTATQFISYLHQLGVAEWNDEQEYNTSSLTNYSGVIYKSLVDDNIGNTPGLDDGNWEVAQGASNKIDKPGVQSIEGSAIFTNSTNNISLTGIGAQGWEIGDVIEITGSANNNKLFTIEFITDDDNIIVNYEHRGGETTKSLVDETIAVTLSLVCKWYLAPIGLGQGWCIPASSRASNTTYTNSTRRSIMSNFTFSYTSGSSTSNLTVDGVIVDEITQASVTNYKYKSNIPMGSEYEFNNVASGSITSVSELR